MTPKIHIVSADSQGRIEGVCMANILCHLPNRVESIEQADVIVVPVAYYGDYAFNPELLRVKKPVVLMSFLEFYGQQDSSHTHLIGINHSTAWPKCANHEWQKLHDWARDSNVVMRFTRELLQQHVSEAVMPIEWPCYLDAWPLESKRAFDVRPFEAMFNWGMSSHLRPMLHGQIYGLMGDGKIDVIGHWDHIDAKANEPHRKWLSIHTPHTHRIHVNEIARRQAQSKMCVSIPGAGIKCFRSTEHLVHTVPVKLADNLAWSFPWEHGNNCLILHSGEKHMAAALDTYCSYNLYDIYVNAQILADKYRPHRYMSEYIMPHIIRAL